MCGNNKLLLQELANKNKRQLITLWKTGCCSWRCLNSNSFLQPLWVFKSTWSCGLTVKHPPLFFFCGLTVCVAWLLVWLDHLVMGWPFTKKLFSSVVFSENGQATARRLNWFLQPLWTFERTCSYGLALKYPRLFFIMVWPCAWLDR